VRKLVEKFHGIGFDLFDGRQFAENAPRDRWNEKSCHGKNGGIGVAGLRGIIDELRRAVLTST
jgi:hypothetical protein